MKYPSHPDYKALLKVFKSYCEMKHEHGSTQVPEVIAQVHKAINKGISDIQKVSIDKKLTTMEPNKLKDIQALRPKGPRKIWESFDKKANADKIEGALIGRMAGCTLGAPVEFLMPERISSLAKELNIPYPPKDYWPRVPWPYELRYEKSPRQDYTKPKMKCVPVDDDVTYTILGLLIAEECGLDFTSADVAKLWKKYLPTACTAEKVALDNIKAGLNINKVGEKNNPYTEWIGADIRSDPWGYIAAGWPEKAAEMAYRDAWVSHRRTGIYGEMFFAAAIAAAFTVKNPMDVFPVALSEIPKQCQFAKAVKWALKAAPEIKNYKDAMAVISKKYTKVIGPDHRDYVGMSPVHTTNNACLTIWGINIGKKNIGRTIAELVAMGFDNDCTAATAGSIVGAVIGKKAIEPHWYKPFNNKVDSYLTGKKMFTISGLVKRFAAQSQKLYSL